MPDTAYEHPLASVFLPEALEGARSGSWTSVALGKWHLAGDLSPTELEHPLAAGFEIYRGSPGYLNEVGDAYDGYFVWRKNVDGVASTSSVYNTTDIVDDVLEVVPSLPRPFFALVAFNAAHTPYHVPPADLWPGDPDQLTTDAARFDAMVEALDTEFGRMLDGLGPALLDDTTLVVIGDNGTSDLVATSFPADQAKGTVHEGGLRVPLVVAGPTVLRVGQVETRPVMAVDLVPTALDLAGVPLLDGPDGPVLPLGTGDELALDGESWLGDLWAVDPSLDDRVVYGETFIPNGPGPYKRHDRAVSDGHYKLTVDVDGVTEFRDLDAMVGLDEGPSLGVPASGEPADAWARLMEALDAATERLVYEGR